MTTKILSGHINTKERLSNMHVKKTVRANVERILYNFIIKSFFFLINKYYSSNIYHAIKYINQKS